MARPAVHGAGLTPYGMYLLAEAYQQSAEVLLSATDRHRRFSDNPIRLLYLQALEGYLRCALRLHGTEPAEIRKYMHNIAGMLEASRLVVTKKTAEFIRVTGTDGDYVRVRYDYNLRHLGNETIPPNASTKTMPRLIAATDDVRHAVVKLLQESGIEVVVLSTQPS